MTARFCLALMLFAGSSARAELDTLWSRQLEIGVFGYAIDAAVLLQNGETMVASSQITEGAINLWRLSLTGETLWQGSFPISEDYPLVLGMAQMDEGHVMIICAFQSSVDQTATLLVKGITASGVGLWERRYPYYGLGYDAGVRKLSDNSVAVCTSVYDFNTPLRAKLFKFESGGDTLWTRAIGPAGNDSQGRDVIEMSNGDLVVCGQYANQDWVYMGFVQRLSPSGNPLWTNTYSDPNQSPLSCSALDVDRHGNILVGGSVGMFWSIILPWAKSFTPDGDEIWSLAGADQYNCSVTGVRSSANGGGILACTGVSSSGFFQAQVLSVSSSGDATLEAQFDQGSMSSLNGLNSYGTRGAVAYGTLVTNEQENHGLVLRFGPGTVVTGFVREEGSNQPVTGARVELVETGEHAFTDVQGIYHLSVSQSAGTIRVSSPCIAPLAQTVTLIEGEDNVLNLTAGVPVYQNGISSLNMIATFGMYERDTIVVSNFGNGDLLYSTSVHEQTPTYGWLSVSPASGVIPPNQSAEIIVSVLADPEHPTSEFFGEIWVHHNSCPDTVNEIGVFVLALDSPEQPRLAESFAMHPAYPNPFNGTTTVQFDLPVESDVQLDIYDIQGRLAKSIAASRFSTGNHVVQIDLSGQATGVYLLRMQAGLNVSVQKLVYLK